MEEMRDFFVSEVKKVPLYAYRCTKCGHSFEKIQSFSSDEETVCPKCSGKLERPLTAPAFNFKGGGWYVNDYAGKSSAPTPACGSGAASAAQAPPCGGGCGATCPAVAAAASSDANR
jgi:putative FmdB family regulatory protein